MRAIFTYHSIDPSGSVISLDAEAFRRHVEWLAAAPLRVTTVEGLLALPPDADAIALTFDDGFENFGSVAWPLLRAYGLPATLFVVTGHVGGANDWDGGIKVPRLPLLDWEALARLSQEGVALGSHGATHERLDRLGRAALEQEIGASAEVIQAATGVRPALFCYPFGRSTRAARDLVGTHYAGAVTTELRALRPGDSPFLLPRLDTFYFRAPGALETWDSHRFHLRLWVRRLARRLRQASERFGSSTAA